MVFVTGDCHSEFQKFSTSSFTEQKEMTKDDIVIICGDFGAVWDCNGVSNAEKYWLNWLDEKPFNRKKGVIWMTGIILEMHDRKGQKYKFEYAGRRNYYPNLSSRSGYGSDDWMFLCCDAENKYILHFQANAEYGYAWDCVTIPPTVFDELTVNSGEDIHAVYYSYFNEKDTIFGLHPDHIDLAKQLVGSEYSRMGKMTDKDFYG